MTNYYKKCLLIMLCMLPGPVLAYIGPGAGLSAIGSVLALIGAVLLMIVGFLWYPIKRLLRRNKPQDSASESAQNRDSNTDN